VSDISNKWREASKWSNSTQASFDDRKLLPKARVITTEEVVKFIIAREEAGAEKAIKDAAKITAKTVAKTANPGPK
jgi:hypothetical protein